MHVWLNGKKITVPNGTKTMDIAPNFDVFVRNGYGVSSDSILCDGDKIVATKKGEMPNSELLQELALARNGDWITQKLKNACVCVCGLGGLGSNIVQMLARLGIGKLILVDFDIVDPTNLNRQNYYIEDIGLKKTIATQRIIEKINPNIKVSIKDIFVTEQNVVNVTEDATVVVEAFDNPTCKAQLVNTILANTDKYVVASSGMAGAGSSNQIKTNRAMTRLYVCGDNVTEAGEGISLMSPRVSICAGHQANMVLRLLLGEFDS